MPPSHFTMPLLPDADTLKTRADSDFGKLLFNRTYVLTVHELFALREALIGSDALIGMLKAGKEISKAIISYKTSDNLAAFFRTHNYLIDAAWGDACLRQGGLLPKVPEVPIVPYVTALEAEPVSWQKLWKFIERERSQGCLKGKKAWAGTQEVLRAKVQRQLDELNMNFIELVKLGSDDLCANTDSLQRTPQALIESTIADVKLEPLSDASDLTTTAFTLSQLEQLQARGQVVRKRLATRARTEGNLAVAAAAKLSGAPQRVAWFEAVEKYVVAVQDDEQAATAWCNMAQVHLVAKDYEKAINACNRALGSMLSYLVEPATFADRRAMTVNELKTGERPAKPPATPWRPVTAADGDKQRALMRKMHIRKGRALAGSAMSQLALRKPQQTFLKSTILPLIQEACENLKDAYDLDTNDISPIVEANKIQQDYVAALKAYQDAGRAAA